MISALLRKTLTNYLFFPIAKHINIAPNLITLLSLPFAFLALVFISLKNWYIALLFIFISSIIDNIDGAVAKLHNKKTRFGSYLDGFCDKIQEFFIYLGLALAGYVFESFVAFSL
ncbi:MAG: CDP-alcohol phosphatidyltransferase family protein, partial [Candidatus Anstonellales archaeon]